MCLTMGNWICVDEGLQGLNCFLFLREVLCGDLFVTGVKTVKPSNLVKIKAFGASYLKLKTHDKVYTWLLPS